MAGPSTQRRFLIWLGSNVPAMPNASLLRPHCDYATHHISSHITTTDPSPGTTVNPCLRTSASGSLKHNGKPNPMTKFRQRVRGAFSQDRLFPARSGPRTMPPQRPRRLLLQGDLTLFLRSSGRAGPGNAVLPATTDHFRARFDGGPAVRDRRVGG